MKNKLSASEKMRIRDLREDVRSLNLAIEALTDLKGKVENSEFALTLENEIKNKIGVMESMKNQLSLLEGKKK